MRMNLTLKSSASGIKKLFTDSVCMVEGIGRQHIDPVHVMSQTRKSAILPFSMVTYAIQSYIKTNIFIQL